MTKRQAATNRYFMILKVFLAITPILCYFYVSLNGMMQGISFQQTLERTPSITIVFLIAMINPYVAYLVHLLQKKLQEGENSFVCINMVLLLIAQLLTMNIVYFTMLAFVFYHAIRTYHISIASELKQIRFKQSIVCGGGSMLVMMLSCVCLFATIRLM